MSLNQTLSSYWIRVQGELLPHLDKVLDGPLGARHQQLVTVLGLVRVEAFVPGWAEVPGRPPHERAALARAFVAKAVFDVPTTRGLIDRLAADRPLRRLCGWQHAGEVPSEATFSRAFAEFAASALPTRLHQALIEQTVGARLIGHISRDSTAIEAREKPVKPALPPAPAEAAPKRKRGRPPKGSVAPPKPVRRIQAQLGMSLAEMLAGLPTACDIGSKRNARGHQVSWIGYKLHIDSADGGIPISALLTSASVHDSQAAIPLATLTASRVTSLYDLMDSAYDVSEIKDHSRSLGHVPIIDTNPRARRGLKAELAAESSRLHRLGHSTAEQRRYGERSNAERVNGGLKDNHGARTVRVRGAAKVMCHLMFGLLTLTALSLMRLVT